MNPLRLLRSLFRPVPRLTPAAAAERLRAGAAVLIDVREPAEWAAGVARGAHRLPLSDLAGRRAAWGPFLAAHPGHELLPYCAAGARSAIAARLLAGEGWRTANAGAYPDWVAAGWPVERPAPAGPGRPAPPVS